MRPAKGRWTCSATEVLQRSQASERRASVVSDDEMVQHTHVDQFQRLADALGNQVVRLAGFGHTRWVAMLRSTFSRKCCRIEYVATITVYRFNSG